jgi:ribosomal protein S12 methylthiotransferase
MAGRYWLETLGCPKNQVDSDKLEGLLVSEGYEPAPGPGAADLVVVNTCAFIEAAREESIGTVLDMAQRKREGARLVVTGCLAERYGPELADALPEVDRVAGFGVALTAGPAPAGGARGPVPVELRRRPRSVEGARGPGRQRPAEAPVRAGLTGLAGLPSFDLLNLPRPAGRRPWAYVKVAEGCDRNCGFCAIPSFRGVQRSRDAASVLAEVEAVGAREVVLVAQDLVSWGRDASTRAERRNAAADGPNLAWLVREVRRRVDRVRLLYIYPSGLTDELVEVIGESGCPYYDLSLQHVSEPLLRRMRRPGSAERFAEKVASVRRRYPDAVLRSSFIVGYPGETEEDHDQLLAFLRAAELDWVGFFPYSREEGTHAAGLPGQVPAPLVAERLRECSELQDGITAARRSALVGGRCTVLVDAPGQGRSHREAPEVDGVVQLPADVPSGGWVQVEVVDSVGPDLVGLPLGPVRQP